MSAPEDLAAAGPQSYGSVIVVGGGCYGSYYVRQLHRAIQAGAITLREIVVVDRDADCRVSSELAERGLEYSDTRVLVADWREFFESYLNDAARDPTAPRGDAIVPSPLMPHLMAEWLVARARKRWPDRRLETRPFDRSPGTPWERAGDDGVHYVSFATWMCPINCIEPRTCPHTRAERTWSMPAHLTAFAAEQGAGAGTTPAVLHCTHRAYGVGMFDTAHVLEADAAIARAAAHQSADVVIGTVSHCHGALTRLSIAGPAAPADSPVRYI